MFDDIYPVSQDLPSSEITDQLDPTLLTNWNYGNERRTRRAVPEGRKNCTVEISYVRRRLRGKLFRQLLRMPRFANRSAVKDAARPSSSCNKVIFFKNSGARNIRTSDQAILNRKVTDLCKCSEPLFAATWLLFTFL
jgi:hypothetical protein